ncbi:MAG TPA: IS200/IS605 family transposase [Candidatus Angelobacter sp.]|nr:IS200/IS605 family transposase [Candidatus Angelobacter sp.]
MSRTFLQLFVHIVFSTKGRAPLIVPDLKPELHAYLGGLMRELKGKAHAINGMENHVHLLVSLPPTLSLSDMLRFIKSNSCRWVHEKWPRRSSFAWQLGYGAFSVSKSNVPEVEDYIRNQEEHHRNLTFQEEFVSFLRKHEIEYDERYIWD